MTRGLSPGWAPDPAMRVFTDSLETWDGQNVVDGKGVALWSSLGNITGDPGQGSLGSLGPAVSEPDCGWWHRCLGLESSEYSSSLEEITSSL